MSTISVERKADFEFVYNSTDSLSVPLVCLIFPCLLPPSSVSPGIVSGNSEYRCEISRAQVVSILDNATDFGSHLLRKYWNKKYDEFGGNIEPEYRLHPALVGAFCLPICLFTFGWSAGRTSFWAPLVLSGFFGIGAMLLFLPILVS